MSERIVDKFTIIKTSEGFMINDWDDYIHAPNGNNTFGTYNEAQLALAHHLVTNAIESI